MRLSFAVSLLLLGGCTVYVPLDPGTPPPAGTNVRATLTTPGALRVSDRVGAPVRAIEGQVLNFWGDSLGLGLYSTTEYGRPWDSTDTLAVSAMEIFQLEEKRIDKVRTALVFGGVGVLSGVVIGAVYNSLGGSGDGNSGEGPDAAIIPLFTIRH